MNKSPVWEPLDLENYEKIALEIGKLANPSSFIQQYQRKLDLARQQPADLKSLIILLNTLASGLLFQSKIEGAIELYKEALKLHKKYSQEETNQRATIYSNLGIAYYEMAEFNKALESYKKAYRIRKKILPSNHPDIALTLSGFGIIYEYQEKYEQATRYTLKALKIREEIYKEKKHPDLAESYHNLALLFADVKDYKRAYENQKKCIEIFEELYGQDHADLDISYKKMADYCSWRDEFVKALEYYLKSVKLGSKYRISHKILSHTCESMGWFMDLFDALENTLPLFMKSYQIMKKNHGCDIPTFQRDISWKKSVQAANQFQNMERNKLEFI